MLSNHNQLRWWNIVTAAIVMLAASSTSAARFWVLMRNGDHFTGDKISSLYGEKGRTKIDGKPLFARDRQVRAIRDSSLQYRLRGSFVEFTNGDVQTGAIVEHIELGGGSASAAEFVVERPATLRLPDFAAPQVALAAASVKRIVWNGKPTTEFQPGLVRFLNGRRFVARGMRFSRRSVRLLTVDQVVDASFSQLSELHLLDRDLAGGAVSDAVWSHIMPDDVLVCIRMKDGSQVTFPRRMMYSDFAKELKWRRKSGDPIDVMAIRPMWARGTLFVPSAEVVSWTFRDYDEVPLTALPVVAVREKQGLHHWPWRRNQSLQGGALRSGGMTVDFGVATHGDSEVAFRLPTNASHFSSWLGLDRLAGQGGCVRCFLFREPGRELLWKSDFIRGSETLTRLKSLPLKGAERLVLVADSAHEGRPPGSDPYDIRDHVDWLMPIVSVARDSLPEADLAQWLPELKDWNLSPAARQRVVLQPTWNEETYSWETSMLIRGDEPLEFMQDIRVSLTNAWLPIEVRHPGGRSQDGFEIFVRVNGEDHGSTMNGHINTQKERKTSVSRVWILGPYAGQDVAVSMIVKPRSGKKKGNESGIVWDRARLMPLVENLPNSGSPIRPDVPLADLTPESHSIGEHAKFENGRLTDGRMLEVRGYPFDAGIGVPTGSEITYHLDPGWRRFVAVIGMADGWKGAGPYQILLDGEPHWSSTTIYARNTPAMQVNIKIPPGHETITLRVGGTSCFGAWANAGFEK